MKAPTARADPASDAVVEPGPVDLLLIHPYRFTPEDARRYDLLPYPPLGILMIAGAARALGYRVAIHDGTFAGDDDDLARSLAQHPPRLIGIGSWSSFRDPARSAIGRLTAAGYPVVAGGPDPSLYPDDYLRAGADAVVIGEGEATVRELLPAVLGPPAGSRTLARLEPDALRAIPGLAFKTSRQAETLTRTLARARLHDLDGLPFAPYDLVSLRPYRTAWRDRTGRESLPLMTARGCPYHCVWCARPVFGRTYVQRPVAHVLEELRHLVEDLGASHIRILDDIFPVRREWIEAWSRGVRQSGLDFRYECLSRADLLTEEVVAALRDSGCVKVFCGVESGSQRILDAMHKGTTLEQTRRARHRLREAGIALHAYLMFGYTGETHRDLRMTIDFLEELQPEEHSISTACPMPGTEFYEAVRAAMPRAAREAGGPPSRLQYRTRYGSLYYRVARALARHRALPPSARGRAAPLRRWTLESAWGILRRRDDLLRPRALPARGSD